MRISVTEQTFVVDGIKANFRQDGRECDGYREFSAETDVVSNTNGSARVRLGGTDVLVGVKAVTGEPTNDGEGEIEFSVDCSGVASPEFADRGGESLSLSIANALRRMTLHATAYSRASLAIVPGTCWILKVDVLVLQCSGGNLHDTVALAVRTALINTKLPVVELVKDPVSGEVVDFEVSSDPNAIRDVGGLENFPLLVSVSEVASTCIVDATEQEECCIGGRLVVAVNAQGSVCCVIQDKSGGIAPAALLDMLRIAQKTSNELFAKVSESDQASRAGSLIGVSH